MLLQGREAAGFTLRKAFGACRCAAIQRHREEFKSPLAHPVMSQDIGDCHETGHPSRTRFSRGPSKP
jgi:hypothetical protein